MWHVLRTGEERRGSCRAVAKQVQGGSKLVRPSHKWEGNITLDREQKGRWWIGFMWYRIEKSGALL